MVLNAGKSHRFRPFTVVLSKPETKNLNIAMDRHNQLYLSFTEEEAYELLTRCVAHDEEDNPDFQSALHKLAEAIKTGRALAA